MLNTLRDYLENQDRKIYIVENGAGCPLAQGLYECPGASRVVYHSECPYGSAKDIYGSAIGNHRMVSKEAVQGILDSVKDQIIKHFNMIVATSFQIRSGGNDTRVPHGWVGISTLIEGQWVDEFFHLTLASELGHLYGRKESIHEIGYEIERIITKTQKTKYVDICEGTSIFDSKGAVFFKNFKPFRLEDVSRDCNRIVLYKGSFNPIHHGHVKIARKVIGEENLVILAISKNTYEKGQLDSDSFIKRIADINQEGFVVAIFENGYFFDNLQYLKNRTGLPVDLAMGVDTFNRLLDCYKKLDFSYNEETFIYNQIEDSDMVGHCNTIADVIERYTSRIFNLAFNDVTFHVFGRQIPIAKSKIKTKHVFHEDFDCQVSSSEIRQLEASGDSETARKLKTGSTENV